MNDYQRERTRDETVETSTPEFHLLLDESLCVVRKSCYSIQLTLRSNSFFSREPYTEFERVSSLNRIYFIFFSYFFKIRFREIKYIYLLSELILRQNKILSVDRAY